MKFSARRTRNGSYVRWKKIRRVVSWKFLFVCLRKLLNELPWCPNQNLCWGHFHCERGKTWIDESWMTFSHDIVGKFLNQNAHIMLCHPHADQQIGTGSTIYQVGYFSKTFVLGTWVHLIGRLTCETYMGVCRAFAPLMLRLGKTSEDGAKTNLSSHCGYETFSL